MVEVWKDIIGYESLYQISSHGMVRDSKRDKPRKVYYETVGVTHGLL
jgi:hypothetical protein